MRVSQLMPAEVRNIESWVYPAQYAMYGRSRDSLYPLALCFGVHDRHDDLVGFAILGSSAYGSTLAPDPNSLDLSFAMSPVRMRQGNGNEFMQSVVEFAEAFASYIGALNLRIVVEDWNVVAVSIAKQQGFEVSSLGASQIVLLRPVNVTRNLSTAAQRLG